MANNYSMSAELEERGRTYKSIGKFFMDTSDTSNWYKFYPSNGNMNTTGVFLYGYTSSGKEFMTFMAIRELVTDFEYDNYCGIAISEWDVITAQTAKEYPELLDEYVEPGTYVGYTSSEEVEF
jgi:hypothetical protein